MDRNRIEFLFVWLKREGFVFWKAVADARAPPLGRAFIYFDCAEVGKVR